MQLIYLCLVLNYLVLVTANAPNVKEHFLVGLRQLPYKTEELSESQFSDLSQLSDVDHLKRTTNEILIPRIVGSAGHKQVGEYIVKNLEDLQWSIELDSFNDTVPIKGNLQFHNIIARLNPNAERYLVLACHYDSKYMEGVEFLGATDSAVPCAMLLNLAQVLHSELQNFRETKLSLMLLFFDGEEAFEKWGPKDSIYGARNLAKKWESQGSLQKIDILMLMDLLGARDPKMYGYVSNTTSWYKRLINIESRLTNAGMMQRAVTSDRYFQDMYATEPFIEDDHIPFMELDVPILHIIPYPFPNVWHKSSDNAAIIDYTTIENLSRIVRLFVMEYLFGILNTTKSN